MPVSRQITLSIVVNNTFTFIMRITSVADYLISKDKLLFHFCENIAIFNFDKSRSETLDWIDQLFASNRNCGSSYDDNLRFSNKGMLPPRFVVRKLSLKINETARKRNNTYSSAASWNGKLPSLTFVIIRMWVSELMISAHIYVFFFACRWRW